MHTTTSSVEDYLKTIYELQQDQGRLPVRTSDLAENLGVTRASVSGMLRKLAAGRPSLITYERYHGTRLTPAGEKIALQVIRHHRLIESYLSAALGFAWDEVHSEAHRLEHVISASLGERLAEALGDPQADPHGEPIPARDGSVPFRDEVRLSQSIAGRTVRVSRVSDDDPAFLRYLAQIGLTLDAPVQVIQKAPFDGPLHVRTLANDATLTLSQRVTDQVFVSVEPKESHNE